MKKLLFSLLCLVCFSVSAEEYFSGKITYEAVFTETDSVMTQEEMKEDYGSNRQEYYITNGFYKTMRYMDTAFASSNTYIHDNGFIYIDGPKRETLGLSNGHKSKSQIRTIEVLKDTLILLDEQCIKVMSYDTIDTTYSYVSLTTKVDYTMFDKHDAGSWNEKLKVTNGALSYKFTVQCEGYEVTFTAVKKEEEFLERYFFTNLPEKPVVAGSWALDKPLTVLGAKSFNQCFFSTVKHKGGFALVFLTVVVDKEGVVKSVDSMFGTNKKLTKKALKAYKKCTPGFDPPTVNGIKVEAETILSYVFK